MYNTSASQVFSTKQSEDTKSQFQIQSFIIGVSMLSQPVGNHALKVAAERLGITLYKLNSFLAAYDRTGGVHV